LSSIYEQFIRDHQEKGAIYTPEVLADYLLSQVETVKPLARGMRVLDPACGSGVFLVLAYRRFIEKELQQSREAKLSPEALRNILVESIFGIERERDACYVAEFSLILTLLHYADLSKLQSSGFRFPALHNNQILECDFFDTTSQSRVIPL
jgi:type I restriction-modification system DNA methylase subunit